MEETKDIFKPKQFSASVKKDGMNDFIFLLNLKADTVTISDECIKFIKFPSANFSDATATITSLIHQEDQKLFTENLQKLKNEKSVDFVFECRMLTPSGRHVPVALRAKYIALPGTDPILTGSITLISYQKDDITGLPLESQMSTDYNEVRHIHGSVSGFILAIRIEGLEHINANFGLEVGDKIFNLVANTCLSVQDEKTRAYRISGNKIALINMGGASATDAQELYNELKRRISDIEFDLDYSVVFTISAGIVAFVNDRSELKDLIKKADFSLLMGKKNGKNNLYFFNSSEYSRHINKLSLHEKLREAVKNNFKGFQIFYQPVIDATQFDKKGDQKVHVIGAEALLRWSDTDLGMVSADQVIPVLEDSGLMAPVGRWILMKAFNQCQIWNQYDKHFHMSVNLSYVQIERSDILFDVECALEKTKVNPENITLEITESGYIDHDELQRLLDEFHKLKINIDIDDFGTGYSNLRYIQNLHANTLKLDYSFVHKAVESKEGDSERKVIEYIINMAHDLGMKVCLEGVESESDVEILSKLKPDKFQGFFFGKPVSSFAFLDNNKKFFREDAPDSTSDAPEDL